MGRTVRTRSRKNGNSRNPRARARMSTAKGGQKTSALQLKSTRSMPRSGRGAGHGLVGDEQESGETLIRGPGGGRGRQNSKFNGVGITSQRR